jgi:hypothetical protein
MWRAKWQTAAGVAERLQLAEENAILGTRSLASYESALRRNIGSYYNGINVLSLAALLEHAGKQSGRSQPALPDFNDVAAAVRLAANAAKDDPDNGVWARATLGELHLLFGQGKEALAFYQQASADLHTWFQVRSMLEQVLLFQELDFAPEAVEPVAALLQKRCEEKPHPGRSTFARVAVCSGHMIDDWKRPEARFPQSKVDAARLAIAEQLEAWRIGKGDLAICGGARGADILFAEECLNRGAKVRLLLAQEMDPFVEDSVRLKKTDWVERFHGLREKCVVEIQPKRLGPIPKPENAANASQFSDIYSRNNLWIINTARVEASSSAAIRALLVWDEKSTGDGPGGTSDFARQVRALGGILEIINPLELKE